MRYFVRFLVAACLFGLMVSISSPAQGIFLGQRIALHLGKNYSRQTFGGTTISKEACEFTVRSGEDSPWITGWPHFTVSFPNGGMFDHDQASASHRFQLLRHTAGSFSVECWSETKLSVIRLDFGQLGQLHQIAYGDADNPFEDACILDEPIQLPKNLIP